MPPSTLSSAPATKLLSSEAKNSAAAAISFGRPIRLSGTAAANCALIEIASSAELAALSIMGGSTGPGLNVLNLTAAVGELAGPGSDIGTQGGLSCAVGAVAANAQRARDRAD